MKVDRALARQILNELTPKLRLSADLSEFIVGINIELEHLGTIAKYKALGVDELTFAGSIALDHLRENSRYYSKLKKVGL